MVTKGNEPAELLIINMFICLQARNEDQNSESNIMTTPNCIRTMNLNKTLRLIHHATKSCPLLFLVLITSPGNAQVWEPSFQIGLNAEAAAKGKDVSLSTYLSHNTVYNAGDHGCFLKISLFYFRVNGLGAIDSVYSRGSLNETLVATIKTNILATEGKWKLPEKSRASDKCWFIFPFIDPGRSKSCLGQQRLSRNALEELLLLYSDAKPTKDRQGRVMLPPNAFPQYAQK